MDTNATRDGTGIADAATASVAIRTDSLLFTSIGSVAPSRYPQLVVSAGVVLKVSRRRRRAAASRHSAIHTSKTNFKVCSSTRRFASHDQTPLNAGAAPYFQLWE
jgi:hypothetical protein